jgi:hypothetical protein
MAIPKLNFGTPGLRPSRVLISPKFATRSCLAVEFRFAGNTFLGLVQFTYETLELLGDRGCKLQIEIEYFTRKDEENVRT